MAKVEVFGISGEGGQAQKRDLIPLTEVKKGETAPLIFGIPAPDGSWVHTRIQNGHPDVIEVFQAGGTINDESPGAMRIGEDTFVPVAEVARGETFTLLHTTFDGKPTSIILSFPQEGDL